MLTETFIASTHGAGKNSANSSLPKDAGIFLHDFQPSSTLQGYFNKSTTDSNCLAVTNTHVFAAQADGAIIKVFSREKGNLETFVPLHEQVTSIACIKPTDNTTILALGTAQRDKDGLDGGRVMLWEPTTGRIVRTNPSHIQPITCLAVDVTGNFLLSGSADSQVHVWSIPALLSYTELDEPDRHLQNSPFRTLLNHEASITAVVTGHSYTPIDIAITASKDAKCNVWDYRSGILLHTFLMGETPLCLAVDPADRGFYAGLATGAVQMVDFHRSSDKAHSIYNTGLSAVPTEPLKADRWSVQGPSNGSVCSLDVSYDGTLVLAGYENGNVFAWDIGAPQNPSTIANLAYPVTNLHILPPTGFPAEKTIKRQLNSSGTKAANIVKPRPDITAKPGSSGLYVPENLIFTTQYQVSLPLGAFTDETGQSNLLAEFDRYTATGNPDLPTDLVDKAMAEVGRANMGTNREPTAGLNSTTNNGVENNDSDASHEIQSLKVQLSIAQKQQKALLAKLAAATQAMDVSI